MSGRVRLVGIVIVACVLASGSVHGDDPPPGERKSLLERVDDAAVVQVYADAFKNLPLEQKVLAYHLYNAAIAGRDIYYDQRHRMNLEMRQVIEAVVSHPEGIDPAVLAEVTRYTKLFWINTGPYNNLTARKGVLRITPEQLSVAVAKAISNGGKISTAPTEDVTKLLARLGPMFFDPEFEPVVTNKTPGEGKDILAASANNLYAGGVTMADLKDFPDAHGLNSRLVKDADGRLNEEVYRVGGRYDVALRAVVHHLEEAAKVAPEGTAKALRALIRFYTTGEDTDRKAYDIAWVEDKTAAVDTINGFVEVYMDPRGVKGSWESAVWYVNPEKTAAIRSLASAAQWFEDHMPWDRSYRKSNVKGITANAIEVVIETGDSGPVTPVGINLPNDNDVREKHGSKSVSLANIVEAYDRSTPESMRKEFCWDEAEAARAEKWSGLASELLVNMHEVIGHASGKMSERLTGKNPSEFIKEYDSALEEGRADLVALYFMGDPKLAELGLVGAEHQAEMARTAYENYARNVLSQLRRVREGSQIEEDHMRNRQMVVHWLIKNSRAIEVRQREGKTYYVVVDAGAFHEGVGRLLAEVQRIKSEGDYAGAKALFDTYGIHFEPKLRDEVVGRVDALKLASYTGFVMPRLEAVRGADGAITDVTISYPCDLTAQMLEYSAAAPRGK
jgi:dipeptidyl-peptidase-3